MKEYQSMWNITDIFLYTYVIYYTFQIILKEHGTKKKAKFNKQDYIKIKRFHTAKESIKNMKKPPTKQEKTSANHINYKGLISKIYKELTTQYQK